jgi:hypothetical protein
MSHTVLTVMSLRMMLMIEHMTDTPDVAPSQCHPISPLRVSKRQLAGRLHLASDAERRRGRSNQEEAKHGQEEVEGYPADAGRERSLWHIGGTPRAPKAHN